MAVMMAAATAGGEVSTAEVRTVARRVAWRVMAVADWPAMCVCRCKAGRAGRSTRARGCCLKR